MCLYFTFLIGGFAVGIPPICGFMSALLQYFFLVFFSWMAVEAVWLYLKLVVVTGSQSLTSKFMLKAGLSAWCKQSLIYISCIVYLEGLLVHSWVDSAFSDSCVCIMRMLCPCSAALYDCSRQCWSRIPVLQQPILVNDLYSNSKMNVCERNYRLIFSVGEDILAH